MFSIVVTSRAVVCTWFKGVDILLTSYTRNAHYSPAAEQIMYRPEYSSEQNKNNNVFGEKINPLFDPNNQDQSTVPI
jgi:hypothetical protein